MIPDKVKAVENPFNRPNNIFGIHIFDESDLDDAASLVNSNGGDWGYVTFVIREDERDVQRWQKSFDKMRRLHLIPIVRVSSRQENGGWAILSKDEIGNWINFFNSLNWVIKNRYIIIGNEPNHSSEWGGVIDPKEYGDYFITFANQLKNTSPDYFVMPAGFDASAANNKISISEEEYIKKLLEYYPDIFDFADGWVSHSYPNPGFSGSEYSSGRGSVRTFEWELELLKDLGVEIELPVFITETGWIQKMNSDDSGLTESEITQKLKFAFQEVWRDKRIVAVTPFILNYREPPFLKFSWKSPEGKYYTFYNEIKNIHKTGGNPIQVNKWSEIAKFHLPLIEERFDKFGFAVVRNSGQKIWGRNEEYNIEYGYENISVIGNFLRENVEPGQFGLLFYRQKQ